MEKLVELLNEYHHFNSDLIYYGWDKEYERVYFHSELPEKEKEKLRKAGIYNEEDDGVDEDWIGDEWICSKKFGFIEWLVENDKIDTDAYKTVYSGDLDKWKTLTMSSGGDEFYQVTEHGVYESLLMLLAIQDEPIEFLISILKNV